MENLDTGAIVGIVGVAVLVGFICYRIWKSNTRAKSVGKGGPGKGGEGREVER